MSDIFTTIVAVYLGVGATAGIVALAKHSCLTSRTSDLWKRLNLLEYNARVTDEISRVSDDILARMSKESKD